MNTDYPNQDADAQAHRQQMESPPMPKQTRPRHSADVKERVLRLRATGLSMRKIAAETGVKLPTIGVWCKGK